MFYNIRVYLYTKLLNSQWLNTKDLFMNYKLANMKFLISNNYNKDMILNEETEFSNYTVSTYTFLKSYYKFTIRNKNGYILKNEIFFSHSLKLLQIFYKIG